MELSPVQLERYRADGFLLIPDVFDATEIAALKADLPVIFSGDSPACVREEGTSAVRSVYGSHLTHAGCARLSEDARLVEPAMQIVGSDVYIYQFKINAKAAFDGDRWEWHQDYIFWRNEDGMPSPRVTNVGLLVDDVTEFNGPMFFIPGSHNRGVIEPKRHEPPPSGGNDRRHWMSHVSATLKYTIDRGTVAELADARGLAAPKGRAGSLLLFDANVVHSSPTNLSPFSRVMVIVTYNSVHNITAATRKRRPRFLVGRNYEPVRPVVHAPAVTT